ncbi:MAG: membrane-bound PQQ-dependent dehydrogenase, glucose/quinate/shikimate family [Salinicola sp.]|uniref:membrane-bound PQQ-dependent dehydrogenase, glucose/quinate/shikimate family n=1 Tax=Salinicola sp. TaxID=1978524 RepID=UPI001E173F22|nr:membrane-bound PQQ-dependent dehydrogenase, glucose/quinate/shikimate family [Salinicola sp.]NRB56961.1 membrane-bound PQQ-dependent dehydrogenase, glucose/quinate/shikimate family [Salinicola sp.]
MSASKPYRLAAWALGAVMAVMGVILIVGGGWLIALGGSGYYLLAGLGLLASGWLLIRRHPAALLLYASLLLATLAWSLWEVGFDWWQLVPRVALPCVLGILLLLPWWRKPVASPLGSGALSVAVGLSVGVAVVAQFTAPGAIEERLDPERRAQVINEAQVAGEDWPAYGGTNAGTHYSALDQITPDNVGQLQEAWRLRTGDIATPTSPPEITNENTPLKVGDSLFLCTSHSRVIAVSPVTGDVQWTFDPELSRMGADDFSGWAHMTCRGVAYYDVSDYADTAENSAANEDGAATGNGAAERDDGPVMPLVPSIGQTDVLCPRRLFLPTADARLIALDAQSGERCAGFGVDGEVDLTRNIGDFAPGGYYATSPPVVTEHLVIVGGHVTDNGSTDEPSGVVRAYDVSTGELVWNWDSGNPEATAPIAPEATYTRNSPNVWAPFSVDERLGLVYLPTGNATPDQYGANRDENDETYGAALVALDLATGRVRWRRQFVHHDLWDMDTPAQPVLLDLQTPDGMLPAVIQPTKQGSLYVLDRGTGEPIVAIDEVKAPNGAVEGDFTAATQPRSTLNLLPPPLTGSDMWGASPIDQMVCRIQFHSLDYRGQYTPPSLEGSLVYPGNVGVFNWSGVAVDPARQAMFTSPNYLAFVSRLIPRDEEDSPAASASEQGVQPNRGAPYAVELGPFLSILGLPCQAPPWGQVAGIDLGSREVVWQHRNGTTRDSMPFDLPIPLSVGVPALGGPMTTAGGVSFLSGTLDQYLRAYDLTSGRELWKSRLPAGGQATPMTYRGADGRQYVVVTAGGHGTFGSRMGDYVVAYALPRDALP